MPTTNFTPKQLENWKSYERVRKGGRYNMYDPRARRLTGLNGDEYSFTMANFGILKATVESNSRKP